MNMVMKLVRAVLGAIILFFDRLFSPRSPERTPEKQRELDQQTAPLAIYQFEACPFCVKVRREVKRLGLKIEYRDVQKSEKFKSELLAGGGQYQVPCLRVPNRDGSVRWMYESDDIINYLRKQFGHSSV